MNFDLSFCADYIKITTSHIIFSFVDLSFDIFTGGAGASTVRLLPALCLTRELADRFLNAFKELVR